MHCVPVGINAYRGENSVSVQLMLDKSHTLLHRARVYQPKHTSSREYIASPCRKCE
jgi:hypothetical protein